MSLFNYECDEIKKIIDEVSPNYPQLTTYKKEWLYFHKYGYIPGQPVDLEYEPVIINPTGSVSNAIPFNYKSAILKGNTMINYAQITSHNFDELRTPIQNLNKPLEKGKKYTIIINIVSQTVTSGITIRFGKDKNGLIGIKGFNGVGLHKHLYTATDDFSLFAPYVNIEEYQSGLSAEYNQLMILEGDYTNVDIPYFEGMQSVKAPVLTTTGNNLWYGDKDVFSNGITTLNMSFKKGTYYFTGDVDTVYPDGPTTIVFSNTSTGYNIGVYINTDKPATLKEDCDQLKIYTNGWSYANSNNKPQTIKNLMLSSTYPISYEPYRSNILTVNEDVELRGIGEVQDELDLLTGELTQRIGEVVFDGSEDWMLDAATNEFLLYHKESIPKSPLLVDLQHFNLYKGQGAIATKLYQTPYRNISLEEFKQHLSQNPITVNYQSATESVKTVDLTPFKPYEGANHYHLTSNIPCEAILEVPVVSTGEQTLQEINNY